MFHGRVDLGCVYATADVLRQQIQQPRETEVNGEGPALRATVRGCIAFKDEKRDAFLSLRFLE